MYDIFISDTRKWSRPSVTGNIPPSRSAGSLVAIGTKLYLFGGLSHMSGWFDDTFVFDTGKFNIKKKVMTTEWLVEN